jgi:DNA-binding response OmpR family regulator
MKILIANLNSEILEDINSSLNKIEPDWNLSAVNSGEQCLKMVKNGYHSDIVITGDKLIDMSGLGLVQKIRDDSDIPIIFISEDNDIQPLVTVFDTGGNDFILSPFSKGILVARIKALVRRRDWDTKKERDGLRNMND